MALNTAEKIHVYAVSPSKEIVHWEEKIREKAEKKGIEYEGPVSRPQETIQGKSFRKRIFRFPYSDRGENLLETELPEDVYIEVSIGTTLDFAIEDIIPDTEIPTTNQDEDSLNKEIENESGDTEKSNTDENHKNIHDRKADEITNRTKPSSDTRSELGELRPQAEEAGVESVPASKINKQRSIQEYTRSSEVRRYVMERADGKCEGCGKPAPFTNKSGEPYLHAHHVYELSDGGSDSPSTVIALCPNCHYRVHHGEDGEEYNKKLQRELKTIEEELESK